MRDNIADKTRELVALAKEGNESAAGQLWAVYGTRVHWIMRLRMGRELRSKLESMDLTQDALLSALGDFENFAYKNEGDFLRWLSTIAENRLRDNLDKLDASVLRFWTFCIPQTSQLWLGHCHALLHIGSNAWVLFPFSFVNSFP